MRALAGDEVLRLLEQRPDVPRLGVVEVVARRVRVARVDAERDVEAMVRLAERLIAAQDLADPEVMLEVEVLEVGTNRLVELGLRFPDSLAVGVVGAGGFLVGRRSPG